MNAFRAQLDRERALMEKEVLEQYARLGRKLLLQEHDNRTALLTKERVKFALIEWEFTEELTMVAGRRLRERCLEEEHRGRVEVDAAEELAREGLIKTHRQQLEEVAENGRERSS
ncbi:unnamed protein product [Phytomonas sp. EM1]|nr:unnamed protein product [Phytomonas sp. EM1]|eukprot:CCW59561.1 unnamed protein product [Phytomonas sp. isolate EM1]